MGLNCSYAVPMSHGTVWITETDVSAGGAGFIKHTQMGNNPKHRAKSKSNEKAEVSDQQMDINKLGQEHEEQNRK